MPADTKQMLVTINVPKISSSTAPFLPDSWHQKYTVVQKLYMQGFPQVLKLDTGATCILSNMDLENQITDRQSLLYVFTVWEYSEKISVNQ